MMVGIGIFATFGAATEAAGSGILVAILLGGSVALATGISAAQLGVNNPTVGGAFIWARDVDRPTLGFIAGCGYLGKNLVSMSVIALAFATYLGQVIPGLPAHVAAAAGVLAITGLNMFGIQLTSRVLIGLLLVVVALLAAAHKSMGQLGTWAILAAAILAALAEILGDLLSASRVVLPMAEAHELPSWLGKIHPRSRTPRRAVLALGLLSAGADLVFDLRPLIEVAGSFMLAWYFITHYAALRLPVRKRLTSPLFTWYGIVGCVGLTIAMLHVAVLAAAGDVVLS